MPGSVPDPVLAATVRQLRDAEGSTRQALALRTGLAVSPIAHIERARSVPNWMTLRRIAAGLDCQSQPMPSKKSAADQKLAKAIRTTRERSGQSQEKAARRAGIDRSYFGSIERGEFNVSLDTIVKIAAGLDTKPSALCARARL
jgi:transcriptional regulator with XRE-family HTH domain